jgi:Protein of unknown function (DUF3617)
MRKSTIAAALAVTFGLSVTARAADFIAEPGLWRGTVIVERDGQKMPAKIHDHCVTPKEMDDSLKNLAQGPIRNTPEETCKKTKFEQTKSTLNWRIECTGKMTMNGDGAIAFDSPQHYTGTVTMTGNMMGHPINNVVHLEGQRISACTGNEKDSGAN